MQMVLTLIMTQMTPYQILQTHHQNHQNHLRTKSATIMQAKYILMLWQNYILSDISNSRQPIAKSDTQLHLLLTEWKVSRPEIFRSYLHINPACFDDLVAVIQDDEVFQNNSNNPQMPVAEQLAIALFRFGHYGNATSTLKVALWAGVGYG